MMNKADEQGPSEQQRKASALFNADMEKLAAKRKEQSRLANEAYAKNRPPSPPPPTRAELEQQLSDAKKRHQTLGSSNWQYADRDQNMTPGEREARKLESTMLDLNRQLKQAKYTKGGKVKSKSGGASKAPQGKKNTNW